MYSTHNYWSVGHSDQVAACAAAPVMIDTKALDDKAGQSPRRPLMVVVSSFGGKSYTFNVAYGVGKAAVDRLASDMSVQLSR